jgi:hypothetical protein
LNLLFCGDWDKKRPAVLEKGGKRSIIIIIKSRGGRAEDMEKDNKKCRSVFELVLMLLLIFSVVPLLTSTAWVVKDVQNVSTAAELEAFDFSSQVGRIQRTLFSFYPGKLYSPEELEDGGIRASDPRGRTARQYPAPPAVWSCG